MEKAIRIYKNKPIYEYTLCNEYVEVSALNYGATITSIKTRDKNGEMANILVSFDEVDSYFTEPDPYLNALVGPVAGRIAHGKYIVDGNTKQLSINSGDNHLHGGQTGISKQIFEVKKIEDEDAQILRFSLVCNHDLDGFEGEYNYIIDYILEGNSFSIVSKCIPEKRTIINMTSHMYFNLSGDLKTSIENHGLLIPAKNKAIICEDGYPSAIEKIIEESAFDFSSSQSIGNNYRKGNKEFSITRAFDTAFLLECNSPIILNDSESGRILKIETDQRSVVVYTANYFDDKLILNHGKKGYPFCGVALETQDIPNGINIDAENQKVYDSNTPYIQKTTYTFDVE